MLHKFSLHTFDGSDRKENIYILNKNTKKNDKLSRLQEDEHLLQDNKSRDINIKDWPNVKSNDKRAIRNEITRKNSETHEKSNLAKYKLDKNDDTIDQSIIEQDKDNSMHMKKILDVWKDRYIDIDNIYKKIKKRTKSLPSDLSYHTGRMQKFIVIDKNDEAKEKNNKQLPFSKEEHNFSKNKLVDESYQSKEYLIDTPTYSNNETNSYDIDDILTDQMQKNKEKSKLVLPFSQRTNSMDNIEPDGTSRDDSPNKRVLKRVLKSNKVHKKHSHYEIELHSSQRSQNNISYVLAVGMTIGAVGMYVASQTVKRGLGLLRYIN